MAKEILRTNALLAFDAGLCRLGIHKWVKGKCARCGKKK